MTSTRHIHDTLDLLFQSLIVNSHDEFSFAGQTQTLEGLDPRELTALHQNAYQNSLVGLMQKVLYEQAYTRHFQGIWHTPTKLSTDGVTEFMDSLSTSNTSRSFWDEGWKIQELSAAGDGVAVATKYGMTRQVLPGEYLSDEGLGTYPISGTPIRIFFPREHPGLDGGFYFSFGESPAQPFSVKSVFRVYWNISAATSPLLLHNLTKMLNRFEVPFRFKCLNNPHLYAARIDNAILYVNRRFHRIALEIMYDLYNQFKDGVLPHTPLFSKALAPGLGLAEDPQNGESFGMSRCRIVAEGLWEAFQKKHDSLEAKKHLIKERFIHYGLSLDAPYLNPKSPYVYDFPIR